MLILVLLSAVVLFLTAYFGYGKFLEKRYDIDDNRPTPSHTDYEGIDRVPANKAILLGHHFSSIAGAGPVVGPIIAATSRKIEKVIQKYNRSSNRVKQEYNHA